MDNPDRPENIVRCFVLALISALVGSGMIWGITIPGYILLGASGVLLLVAIILCIDGIISFD